ncbi:MAG: porin family protein [Chitinophagales bacterium]
MKNSIFLSLLIVLLINISVIDALAQEVESSQKGDTTTISIGEVDITIMDNSGDDDDQIEINISDNDDDDDDYDDDDSFNRIKTRWLMLDIGINSFIQDGKFGVSGDESILEINAGKSFDFNLYVFKQRIGIIQNHMNLVYGLGFDFSNYGFAQNVMLEKNTNPLAVTTLSDEVDLKKNKLHTIFLNVPLMINFETNKNKSKSFRASAGVYAGVLLGGKTKQKNNEGDITKVKDDFNINRFRYGLTGQIGVGPINFFANYSLTPMFNDGLGDNLQPLTVGLSVIPF